MAQSEIDPLSQMIGGLSAQYNELRNAVTDLRSEIVVARTQSYEWREKQTASTDRLYAEIRTVKHENRNYEMMVQALDIRLGKMETKLEEIEATVKSWKSYGVVIIAIVALLGFVIEVAGPPIIANWLK